jgi:hypothetical protein
MLGPQPTIGYGKEAYPRLPQQQNRPFLNVMLAHFHNNLHGYAGTQVLTMASKLGQLPALFQQRWVRCFFSLKLLT